MPAGGPDARGRAGRRAMLLRLLLARQVAGAGADRAPLPQTAWQRDLVSRVQEAARGRSNEAASPLTRRLSDPRLRAELERCSTAAANLDAGHLAERLREEVRVAEVVSGFFSEVGGFPDHMNLDEFVAAPYFESNWQVAVRHQANHSANHSANQSGWYNIQDDIETKLYGFRPFARHGSPRTLDEANERPAYSMVNLFKVDAGSPLYGDISVVFSPSAVRNVSVVSGVDTGGWSTMCNSSRNDSRWHKYLGPNYRPNCTAYKGFASLGTLSDFDHLVLANEKYWNSSLSHMLCRILAPWGKEPIAGRDLIHYWEAMPAATLAYPQAIKFVIGSYPDLFGSERGARLQQWCSQRGWVLVWSLGLNQGSGWWDRPNFFTAGKLRGNFSSDQRLADPTVLRCTTAGANVTLPSSTPGDFSAAWGEAQKWRGAAKVLNTTVSPDSWAASWARLAEALPGALRLEPLRSGACGDVEGCVGTDAEGRCVCYSRGGSEPAGVPSVSEVYV